MACKYCGKPVVLRPTAKERAARYGGKPADYTALFPNHATCEVEARSAGSVALMQRLNSDLEA